MVHIGHGVGGERDVEPVLVRLARRGLHANAGGDAGDHDLRDGVRDRVARIAHLRGEGDATALRQRRRRRVARQRAEARILAEVQRSHAVLPGVPLDRDQRAFGVLGRGGVGGDEVTRGVGEAPVDGKPSAWICLIRVCSEVDNDVVVLHRRSRRSVHVDRLHTHLRAVERIVL